MKKDKFAKLFDFDQYQVVAMIEDDLSEPGEEWYLIQVHTCVKGFLVKETIAFEFEIKRKEGFEKYDEKKAREFLDYHISFNEKIITIGIVCDNYKLTRYEEELNKADFMFISSNLTKDTTAIKVVAGKERTTEVKEICLRLETYFNQRKN